MSELSVIHGWMILGGLALSVVFGYVAARSNFCVMGAISDAVNIGHFGRLRMTATAMAVAMLGTTYLSYSKLISLEASIYLRPSVSWLSMLIGGALFGIGMTMAGGCANRNLMRVGGGSIRSIVVLVFTGISAYMTMKGLFAQWRVTFLDSLSFRLDGLGYGTQSLGEILGKLLKFDTSLVTVILALVFASLLLVFAFSDSRFRKNMPQWSGGIVLGGLIVLAWLLTGKYGFGEHPETMEMVYFATGTKTLESFSFVAPLAWNLELLLLWTDKSLSLTFGGAMAIGIVFGSFLYAKRSGTFKWEGFANFDDLRGQLIGAVLMGFGGVTALGCTVGQGLSGISTMALGSFLAVIGIFVGSYFTLKWQARD